MKRQNNKGFTLVELIVVLVILAILAAILVPALLGYIDKAKEENFIIQAEYVERATQTLYVELYAKDIKAKNINFQPGGVGFWYSNVDNNIGLYDNNGKVQTLCTEDQKATVSKFVDRYTQLIRETNLNGYGVAKTTRFGCPIEIEFDKKGNITKGKIVFCPLKANGEVESFNDGHSVEVQYDPESRTWNVVK